MRLNVHCSRDARGDEIPVRLDFDDRTVLVAEILDRWPGQAYCYFKIRGEDGSLYVIRHNEEHGTWELTLFQRVALPVLDTARPGRV